MLKNKYEKSLIFLLFLVFLFGLFFFIGYTKKENAIREAETKELIWLNTINSKIGELELQAKAISIYDITLDKKLFGRNDTLPLPLASLAKIMSALVAISDNTKNEITISERALKEVGDNSLFVNEKWNKDDLIKFSLILSSNDGMFALAENDSAFLEEMNNKARRLGLKNMSFKNVSGLDISPTEVGGIGTAEEVNMLNIFAFKYFKHIFSATNVAEQEFTSLSNLKHKAPNTNLVLEKIPNLLFSKTGNTNLAGGNLAIIFRDNNGHDIAVTILGSTTEGRFEDILAIVDTLNQISI